MITGSYTALIVEDEPNMQTLLRLTLSRAGFDVTMANDGLAARAVLRERSFDLVCSDVMMSGIDGIQLCKWIKTERDAPSTPVLLISSRAQCGDREAGIAAGADIYMTKPFDIQELEDAARTLAYSTTTR